MYEISGSGLEDREDNVEIMKGNRNYGIDLLKIVMDSVKYFSQI